MIEKIPGIVFLCGLVACVVILVRRRWPRRKKAEAKTDWLDQVLFRWDDANTLTIRNLLAGGIHVFGRTDGGKTSSMKQVARAILECKDSSLLVLCSKRGEYREWLGLVTKAKRDDDVILVDPKKEWRFNMIGYFGESKAGAEAIVRFIMEMKSAIFRENQASGGESAVWRKYDETAIRNCVVALMCAKEEVTSVNLHRMIVTAPVSPSELESERWQEDYCNEILKRGFDAEKTPMQQMDFEQSMDYLLRVWPGMGDRTRGSVLMGVAGTLSAMNIGMAREMFASATNITPKAAIEGRKIVIVNMPPDEWGDVGLLANIGWKYHWQKEVLKREVSEESPVAGIWGDESSLWVSDFDSDFVSRCRSYRGFQVYICQSIANYEKTLPSDKAEAIVESLVSNFSHKVFFALGSAKDAEYAADLCGKHLEVLAGGSVQHAPWSMFEGGGEHHSSSFHEQYEYLVRPEDFMVGLRTGSPANNYMVDAIVVRSGKPFASGYPMVQVSFDQRKS
jgi:hypothetical protein